MIERLRRLDPVTWVLFVHALILVILGHLDASRWVLFTAVSLVVWRVTLDFQANRATKAQRTWLRFAKGAGSLVLAGTMMLLDGGTESPFFFWLLILLGWSVMVYPRTRFVHLVAVGMAVYVGVIALLSEWTPASFGRLMLLLSYCGILFGGRIRFEASVTAARRASRLLRDAFWVAPVGMAVVEGEPPRLVYSNQTAHSMRLLEGDGPDEASEHVNHLVENAIRSGVTVGPELIERHGSQYLRVVAAPHSIDGQDGAVVCAEDVTSQVNAGEERKRFLQLASHQLRTPLTPIIGYARMLQQGDLDPSEWQAAAEVILQEASRLERLFERMGTVVRLQHESRRADVDTTMGEILDQLASSHPEVTGGVMFDGDRAEGLRCHVSSVVGILAELLDNGHRFGQPPVRVSWYQDGDEIVVKVIDAGPGPDAHLAEHELFGEWGQIRDIDRMPNRMGTRLGLLQARLFAGLTGSQLQYMRNDTDWAFVIRLATTPARTTTDLLGTTPFVASSVL